MFAKLQSSLLAEPDTIVNASTIMDQFNSDTPLKIWKLPAQFCSAFNDPLSARKWGNMLCMTTLRGTFLQKTFNRSPDPDCVFC